MWHVHLRMQWENPPETFPPRMIGARTLVHALGQAMGEVTERMIRDEVNPSELDPPPVMVVTLVLRQLPSPNDS